MPGYGPQITPADRWAIVAWVRALQASRNATIDDVPADVRATLE
jgi:mono/diheme cytochrome c family protein